MRDYAGLCDTKEFVDLQIGVQIQWLDENDMYRDAAVHPPVVYDYVPRGLFAVLLHLGYKGAYRHGWRRSFGARDL